MGNRRWGPTGVGEFKEQKLSADTHEHLREILKPYVDERPRIDAFLHQMNEAYSHYLSDKLIADRSKPGFVRRNLKEAIAAGSKFKSCLSNLDPQSLMLARENSDLSHSDALSKLDALITRLEHALTLAMDYQNGGLVNHEKQFFGARVARAMGQFLNITATNTKDGLFSQIMSAIMEGIGERSQDVGRLVSRSLSVEIEVADDNVLSMRLPTDKT